MGDASAISGTFRGSDQAGLAAAIVLHAGLAALLVMQIDFGGERPGPVSEGMTVNLASEVSLESTAPDPVAEARAATAPTLGDSAPLESESEAIPRPDEAPTPRTRSSTAPRTPPSTRPSSRPSNTPRTTPASTPGSSSFDKAFEQGSGASPTSQNTGSPAKEYGPSEVASLKSTVGRQVRIKWQGRVPQGPDAEKLVTRVRFKLNPNGTLLGEPQVLGTTGVTDLNRNQVGRHREEAVRSIKLVGRFRVPFDVPAAHNTFTIKFDR